MYLLAKKLPHTLVSGENEQFKELLKDTKAEEIVRFAAAVGAMDAELDKKICKNHTGNNGNTAGKWVCREGTMDSSGKKFSEQFTEAELKTADTGAKWPEKPTTGEGGSGKVSEGLSGLQRTEKYKVAGLLSKTISGAEVVEIRAVSTTSVMLNACYDLQIVTATDQRNTFVVRRTTTAITRLGFVWGC